MDNLLDTIRKEFFSRLQTNTTWGRNQIQALYTEVQRDVLSSYLDDSYIMAYNSIIPDISKPSKQLITRRYTREEGDINDMVGISISNPTLPKLDIRPDDEENPFKSDSDINKGL